MTVTARQDEFAELIGLEGAGYTMQFARFFPFLFGLLCGRSRIRMAL